LIEVSRQEVSGGIAGWSDSGMFGFTDGVALAGNDVEPLLDVGSSVGVGLGWSSVVTFAAGVAEIDCAGAHEPPAVVNWVAEAATGPPAGITVVPNSG
jgi:hypothetical protein